MTSSMHINNTPFTPDIVRSISTYLNIDEIYNFSMVNKEINKSLEEIIFEDKVQKIPVLQSSCHSYTSDSKMLKYSWTKNNFTPEQIVKINMSLLDRLSCYQEPRYGMEAVIFSLYENGLMYQLPSHNHIIKVNKSDVPKQFVFTRIFMINPIIYHGRDYLNTLTNSTNSENSANSTDSTNSTDLIDVQPKSNYYYYSNISVISDKHTFEFDKYPQLEYVIKNMEKLYIEKFGKITFTFGTTS